MVLTLAQSSLPVMKDSVACNAVLNWLNLCQCTCLLQSVEEARIRRIGLPCFDVHGTTSSVLTPSSSKVRDVLHAKFFGANILCVHSFQKNQKCCNTTIPQKSAWSQTNHGNSTPTRRGFENTVSRQKRSAMDNFSRTYGLPITVRIVEENSLVNLFSEKLYQIAIFKKKRRNSEPTTFASKKRARITSP